MPTTDRDAEPIHRARERASMPDHDPFDADLLPDSIRRYLDAVEPAARRALADDVFTDTARVVDEGVERLGRDAVRAWLEHAASEYTYTTTCTGQSAAPGGRWTVHTHLRGDFPGGEADLRLQFRLRDERIAELVIEP
jgi:hypothetical protein